MVDTRNSDLMEMGYYWKLVRDFVRGEKVIKDNGELYLPRKAGETDSDYKGYLARAKPGDYTSQLLNNLHGMIMRRPPVIEYPDSPLIRKILKNFDGEGHTVYQSTSDTVMDNMQTSFGGILVDMPSAIEGISEYDAENMELLPFAKYYPAETIVSRKYIKTRTGKKLAQVVLKERIDKLKNEFEVENIVQYRVISLDENGDCYVRIFGATNEASPMADGKAEYIQKTEPVYITVRGSHINFIPFVFCPGTGTNYHLEKPMLYGVAELHKHYYMQSADYENGVHFTTVPTLWITGHDDTNTKDDGGNKLVLGGDTALVLPEAEAKIGTVQFSGEGLSHAEKAKSETLEQIGILGSRTVAPDKAMSETSDAARIHRVGENSRLATYAKNMSECYTKVLEIMADWIGVQGNVSVQFNMDYDTTAFDPNALNAIANLSREGKFPLPLVFEALKKGEYLPNEFTLQDYMVLLEVEFSGASISDILQVYQKIRSGESFEIKPASVPTDRSRCILASDIKHELV